MPGSPFDFEDPERFAPLEVDETDEDPDVIVQDGVRLRHVGLLWECPHGRRWGGPPYRAAALCYSACPEDEEAA